MGKKRKPKKLSTKEKIRLTIEITTLATLIVNLVKELLK